MYKLINPLQRTKKNFAYRVISCLLIFSFSANSFLPSGVSYAQTAASLGIALPTPGTVVSLSPAYIPAHITGLTIDPTQPFKFYFMVDSGDDHLEGEELRRESMKLIKYFMAALTVPESQMWVNLSPYEKNRIIADGLGSTEMGRDMLAQDYLLKQLTASILSPENELGKKFWDKLRAQAKEEFGDAQISDDILGKIWITPDKASVYVYEKSAFVVKSHLRVMHEQEYLNTKDLPVRQAGEGRRTLDVGAHSTGQVTEQVMKEVILPAIEIEVNEGRNFAQLRQIFNSMILATWYKNNLKSSIINKVYSNQNKLQGVELSEQGSTDKIYEQYLEAFKKGVYDFIKEDYDPTTQEIVPRKYFVGGEDFAQLSGTLDAASLSAVEEYVREKEQRGLVMVKSQVGKFTDAAMTAQEDGSLWDKPEQLLDMMAHAAEDSARRLENYPQELIAYLKLKESQERMIDRSVTDLQKHASINQIKYLVDQMQIRIDFGGVAFLGEVGLKRYIEIQKRIIKLLEGFKRTAEFSDDRISIRNTDKLIEKWKFKVVAKGVSEIKQALERIDSNNLFDLDWGATNKGAILESLNKNSVLYVSDENAIALFVRKILDSAMTADGKERSAKSEEPSRRSQNGLVEVGTPTTIKENQKTSGRTKSNEAVIKLKVKDGEVQKGQRVRFIIGGQIGTFVGIVKKSVAGELLSFAHVHNDVKGGEQFIVIDQAPKMLEKVDESRFKMSLEEFLSTSKDDYFQRLISLLNLSESQLRLKVSAHLKSQSVHLTADSRLALKRILEKKSFDLADREIVTALLLRHYFKLIESGRENDLKRHQLRFWLAEAIEMYIDRNPQSKTLDLLEKLTILSDLKRPLAPTALVNYVEVIVKYAVREAVSRNASLVNWDSNNLESKGQASEGSRKYSSKTLVEQVLKERQEQGLSNYAGALQKRIEDGGDVALYKAAREFKVALPKSEPKYQNKESVQKALLEREAQGLSIKPGILVKSKQYGGDNFLYLAAKKYKVELSTVRYPNVETVEAELKRREAAGLSNKPGILVKSKANGGDFMLYRATQKFRKKLLDAKSKELSAKKLIKDAAQLSLVDYMNQADYPHVRKLKYLIGLSDNDLRGQIALALKSRMGGAGKGRTTLFGFSKSVSYSLADKRQIIPALLSADKNLKLINRGTMSKPDAQYEEFKKWVTKGFNIAMQDSSVGDAMLLRDRKIAMMSFSGSPHHLTSAFYLLVKIYLERISSGSTENSTDGQLNLEKLKKNDLIYVVSEKKIGKFMGFGVVEYSGQQYPSVDIQMANGKLLKLLKSTAAKKLHRVKPGTKISGTQEARDELGANNNQIANMYDVKNVFPSGYGEEEIRMVSGTIPEEVDAVEILEDSDVSDLESLTDDTDSAMVSVKDGTVEIGDQVRFVGSASQGIFKAVERKNIAGVNGDFMLIEVNSAMNKYVLVSDAVNKLEKVDASSPQHSIVDYVNGSKYPLALRLESLAKLSDDGLKNLLTSNYGGYVGGEDNLKLLGDLRKKSSYTLAERKDIITILLSGDPQFRIKKGNIQSKGQEFHKEFRKWVIRGIEIAISEIPYDQSTYLRARLDQMSLKGLPPQHLMSGFNTLAKAYLDKKSSVERRAKSKELNDLAMVSGSDEFNEIETKLKMKWQEISGSTEIPRDMELTFLGAFLNNMLVHYKVLSQGPNAENFKVGVGDILTIVDDALKDGYLARFSKIMPRSGLALAYSVLKFEDVYMQFKTVIETLGDLSLEGSVFYIGMIGRHLKLQDFHYDDLPAITSLLHKVLPQMKEMLNHGNQELAFKYSRAIVNGLAIPMPEKGYKEWFFEFSQEDRDVMLDMVSRVVNAETLMSGYLYEPALMGELDQDVLELAKSNLNYTVLDIVTGDILPEDLLKFGDQTKQRRILGEYKLEKVRNNLQFILELVQGRQTKGEGLRAKSKELMDAATLADGEIVMDENTGRIRYQGEYSDINPAVKLDFELWGVRHGQTFWNAQKMSMQLADDELSGIKTLRGISESEIAHLNSLTDKGKQQVQQAAEELFDQFKEELGTDKKAWSEIVVVASSKLRAQETAKSFIKVVQEKTRNFLTNSSDKDVILSLIIDPRINEINGGNWQNLSQQELEDFLKVMVKSTGGLDARAKTPTGESYLDLLSRTKEMLLDFNKRYAGKKVVMFGHKRQLTAVKNILGYRDLLDQTGQIDWNNYRLKNAKPMRLYSPEKNDAAMMADGKERRAKGEGAEDAAMTVDDTEQRDSIKLSSEDIEGLINQLHGVSDSKVIEATVKMAESGNKDFVPELILILTSPRSRIREAAVRALRKLDDDRCLTFISNLFKSEKDERVINQIYRVLGHFKHPQAFEILVDGFKSQNSLMIEGAAYGLGDLGNTDAITLLKEKLFDENDWIRQAVVYALGKLGLDDKTVGLLIARLNQDQEDSVYVQQEIIRAFGQAKLVNAVPVIIHIMRHTHNGYILKECINALGAIKDPQVFNELVKRIEFSSPKDRKYMYASLRQLDMKADYIMLTKLISRLTVLDFEERKDVILTLAVLGDRSVRQQLIFIAKKDGNPEIRKFTAEVLEKTIDKETVLEQEAAALGQTKDSSNIDKLVLLLTSDYKNVRKAAAKSLGLIGSPGSDIVLREALEKESSNEVRDVIVVALKKLNELARHKPGEYLSKIDEHNAVTMLESEDFSVRSKAIRILVSIKDQKAFEKVARIFLTDLVDPVRAAAARYLGNSWRSNSQRAIQILQEGKSKERDFNVNQAIDKALRNLTLRDSAMMGAGKELKIEAPGGIDFNPAQAKDAAMGAEADVDMQNLNLRGIGDYRFVLQEVIDRLKTGYYDLEIIFSGKHDYSPLEGLLYQIEENFRLDPKSTITIDDILPKEVAQKLEAVTSTLHEVTVRKRSVYVYDKSEHDLSRDISVEEEFEFARLSVQTLIKIYAPRYIKEVNVKSFLRDMTQIGVDFKDVKPRVFILTQDLPDWVTTGNEKYQSNVRNNFIHSLRNRFRNLYNAGIGVYLKTGKFPPEALMGFMFNRRDVLHELFHLAYFGAVDNDSRAKYLTDKADLDSYIDVSESFAGDMERLVKEIIKSRKNANEQEKDSSVASAPGGIDFNPAQMNLETQGQKIDFEFLPIDPTTFGPSFQGFEPVIINIVPINNFSQLLGFADIPKEEQLSAVLN